MDAQPHAAVHVHDLPGAIGCQDRKSDAATEVLVAAGAQGTHRREPAADLLAGLELLGGSFSPRERSA
jgi:hypothetical protein